MNTSSEPAISVLFFDHTAQMGGGEVSLLNLVTHLDHNRFRPVVVLGAEGPLREKLSGAGVETHVLPLSPAVAEVRKDSLTGPRAVSWRQGLDIACYIWRLRSFTLAHSVQILHTNSLKADIIGGIVGRLSGVPVIWHVRDRIADDYLPSRATRAFRLLCRFLPNYVVVNSAATLEALQLPSHRRARVVHNGIIHDGLCLQDFETRDGGKGDYNLESSRPERRIGLVGRISPWKGQDVFLRAAAKVREEHPDARFQIIGAPLFGEEEFEAQLRCLCTELGLESCVEWLGFRSDVSSLLSKLTLLVHASKTGEPFGQVVVEGMMAGLPVVATNGGGIPEIVIDGETGLLVPMNDVDSMAAAILCLLDDPSLGQALGRAGRLRAAEHFTIARTAAKISCLYEDVLQDRKEDAARRRFNSIVKLVVGFCVIKMAGHSIRARLALRRAK